MIHRFVEVLPWILGVTSLLAFFQAPAWAGRQTGIDPMAAKKIDDLCRGIVQQGYAPGVVLLIGIEDDILMRKAYGDRMTEPHQEPMTVDTIFDMASVTKPTCTASTIMFLVQDGRISVDDPVHQYLAEFSESGKEKITIRSLLTHCSGLPAYTSADYLE